MTAVTEAGVYSLDGDDLSTTEVIDSMVSTASWCRYYRHQRLDGLRTAYVTDSMVSA